MTAVLTLSMALTSQTAHAAAAATSQSAGPLAVIKGFAKLILDFDKHLLAMIDKYGAISYGILFSIIFAETGLVIAPFLPGDSLLFAAGAIAGMGKLSLPVLLVLLNIAAILGDATNYIIGAKLGDQALKRKIVSQKSVDSTNKFYEKYGGKTIILARFVPVLRTFAPFVAGVSRMTYSKFAVYNIAGAILWTAIFLIAGFVVGTAGGHHNMTVLFAGIVGVSVLPIVVEVGYSYFRDQRAKSKAINSQGENEGGLTT